MRKLAQGGGISINKAKLGTFEQWIGTEDLLQGKYIIVQKGKKNYFLITVGK
jgi:tyrosyl-tRNA synthetase